MAITIDETGIKIDGVLKVDINTAVQLANKADLNGSSSQRFKVADAINNNEAINKEQLLAEIGNIDLSSKADLNGSSSQRFKVADAINNNEAINKEQLLAEIGNIDLSSKADLNGSSSQRFKVADAINNNEAINKEQLLAEIEAIGGAGSGLDADKVRGLPADFSSSKNTNGYQKLPSGLIIQWGVSGRVYTNNDITVIFPITFPNNVFTVTATRDTRVNDDSWSNVRDLTESGFITRAEFNGSGGTDYGYARWIAIGY